MAELKGGQNLSKNMQNKLRQLQNLSPNLFLHFASGNLITLRLWQGFQDFGTDQSSRLSISQRKKKSDFRRV